jgi:hypothetical protein
MGVPTNPRDWFQEACQHTRALKLEKGKQYAIEVAFYNQDGIGHGEVGWLVPGAKDVVPVPLATADGIRIFLPYQVPANDADDDALPDEWERAHGLAVDPQRGDQGGFADPNQDGWSLQADYFDDKDPGRPLQQQGCMTLYLTEYLTPLDEIYFQGVTSVPYQSSLSNMRRIVTPLDWPGIGCGRYLAMARALLTAPADGYYKLSLQCGGSSQLMLSDDATPEHIRSLLVNGGMGISFRPGEDKPFQGTDTGWVYLKRGEPRFLEIRYLHDCPPSFLLLGWTLPDGTRQPIPSPCIISYIEPEPSRPKWPRPDSEWCDARFFGKDFAGKTGRVDLFSAKSQVPGWACHPGTSKDTAPAGRNDETPDLCLTGFWVGDLEWFFSVDEPGYYVMSPKMQLSQANYYWGLARFEREIDGARLYHEYLCGKNGNWRQYPFLTPWLAKGKHILRLHFTPIHGLWSMGTYSVKDITYSLVPTGAATEEVRAHLGRSNGFLPERGDGGHLISPACIEATSRATAAPALLAGGKSVAMREASPRNWWADITLPASGADVPLEIRSATDQTVAKANARWEVARVADHPVIYLRTGDSLRISAYPADGNGTGVLRIGGKDIGNTRKNPHVMRFDKAGDEVVEARFTPEGAAETTARMVVHVLSRYKTPLESPWGTTDSGFVLADLPAGVWPDGGDMSGFRPIPAGAGLSADKWMGSCSRGGIWPAALRAGPHGPVLGTLLVRFLERVGFSKKHYTDSQAEFYDVEHLVIGWIGLPPGWKQAYQIEPKPGSRCQFYHPDLANPLLKIQTPYRMGPVALSEIYLQGESRTRHTARRESWLVSPEGLKVK